MLCLEFWTFELMTLQAGYLTVYELSANIFILNTDFLMFMFPLAVSYSATALVGKSIGRGNVKEAKKYAIMI